MKVSIITIVFNNVNFIQSCMESVFEQTYDDVEYIIIDGGSTDGTQSIIQQYNNKIDFFVSERDYGLYDALNKGIKKATGDIIGILHSDDLYFDIYTLQKVVDAFVMSGADLIYANGQYVDKEDIFNVRRIYPAKPFKKQYLQFGWVPLHTTMYVKRELFQKYGLYDINYSICSDYEISLRWLSNPEVKSFFLDSYLVKMRLGGKSTNPKLQRIKSNEDYDIIKRYKLLGAFTLFCKIGRKIPQYLSPILFKYCK